MIDPSEFANVQAQNVLAELAFLADAVSRRIALQGSISWPHPLRPQIVAEVARLHKLTLFLPATKDQVPPGCEGLLSWTDMARLRTLQMNWQSLAASAEVTERLTDAGIAHLQFKGPLQQLALYGTLFQKPVGDADVLVHRADRKRAYQIMRQAGFVPTEESKQTWWSVFLGEVHFRKNGDGPMVDLHHTLQQPGLPSPYLPGKFLDRLTWMTFEGRNLPVASPEDRCLIAAISVTKALYAQEPCGGSAVDLWAAWRLLGPEQRTETRRLARLHGLLSTLGLAARVAVAMFGEAARDDFHEPRLPMPLPEVSDECLAHLAWQPWAPQTSRLRRRAILAGLCADEPLRFAKEAARAIASDVYRKALDSRPKRSSEGGA